jgi:hypothetical protein
MAFDLYITKGVGAKIACSIVANEGSRGDANPCAKYSDAGALSDQEKRNAMKLHMEQSLFSVARRAPRANAGKCKDGESKAESHSCV